VIQSQEHTPALSTEHPTTTTYCILIEQPNAPPPLQDKHHTTVSVSATYHSGRGYKEHLFKY